MKIYNKTLDIGDGIRHCDFEFRSGNGNFNVKVHKRSSQGCEWPVS